MNPVHVLEKETVYMKNNMEIKITEIKNDSTIHSISTLSLVGITYSIVVIIKQNERNTDMYTPLTFLTGKIFQYMVQPIFTSLPTYHPPTTFFDRSRVTVFNSNPINICTF